jgi:hypothetical protein
MKKVINFFKLWPDWWSVPLTFLGWFFYPYLMHQVDPEAGFFDAGVLEVIVIAVLAIISFNAVAYMGVKFNWGIVFRYYADSFSNDFKTLTPWQKVKITLFVYSLYLLALVATLMRIMPVGESAR